MQTALGSQYVNDFDLGQRNYRVYVQADLPFRDNPEDANQLYVRSERGEVIPLSNLVTISSGSGAQTIHHYNLFRLREQGLSLVKAAIEASQERLRPILMTGFSSLIGFFPLLIATGAGSASRRSIGTAAFGGYLVATFLSLFLVPVLYIVIKSLFEQRSDI